MNSTTTTTDTRSIAWRPIVIATSGLCGRQGIRARISTTSVPAVLAHQELALEPHGVTSSAAIAAGERNHALDAVGAGVLQDIADRLAKDSVTARGVVVIGAPVDEINRAADRERTDLIVMGTHGRTGTRHLVAGSVAERIVRTSKAPVLTIRYPE
jgi:nucleotide-binding universal stress UspA family protein